jgi:hypothetical protein
VSCPRHGTLLVPWGVTSLRTSHLHWQLGASRASWMMHKVRQLSRHKWGSGFLLLRPPPHTLQVQTQQQHPQQLHATAWYHQGLGT